MIDSIEIGRKEDGNRSIANKIKDRLHDLDKTVENNYGRWAWELLQNAKDSISNNDEHTVSIHIELNSDSVVFRHNGLYFTDLDIRGLINQISSKEVEDGVETKNTGRFGTGFLTTHLLSKKVEISGIVKAKEGLHNFNFLLDRDGATTEILAKKVEASWSGLTESKKKYFKHIQSILKITDDLKRILYPDNIDTATSNQEGKILSRILYSSFADNFETYMSDLLYEIFLAKPETLKSEQTVTVKEVLNCTDLQDFIEYWAKQKIGKLQKGSVKGFIEDTPQIKKLNVLRKTEIKEIDRLLQIRHLYAHRNGVIDDKFLKFYPESGDINMEYIMSINIIVEKLEYFIGIVNSIDEKAIEKYSLTR